MICLQNFGCPAAFDYANIDTLDTAKNVGHGGIAGERIRIVTQICLTNCKKM